MEKKEMNDGYFIPSLAYGTYQAPDGEIARNSVKRAIELGYTHIDGAAIYMNEKSVGQGIKDSAIAREDLFVTSKVWNTERGYDRTLKAFEKTLTDLDLDYLDLYLIHWPANEKQFSNWRELNSDTWRALEYLKKQGVVRSIGLSNFLENHLESLIDNAEIMPAVNQIEFHPGFWQPQTTKFCQERNIIIEGWAPLGAGRLIEDEVLLSVAAKYGKTAPQIALRWALQHNVVPLPKSVTPSRMEENLKVFDFEIQSTDMKLLDELPLCAWSGFDPNEADF